MKNKCLNFLKGISCIGVILMHCSFPTVAGEIVKYTFKFAVPIFFMISGYFAYYESHETVKNKLPKKMIHILKLMIVSEVFYGVWALLKRYLWNDEMNMKFGFHKIFLGTFFNRTLWFLYALFWAYALLYIINQFDLYKVSYKLAPVALLFHVIVRMYARNLEWVSRYDVMIFRNFAFYALPFMMIGNWIHKNKDSLCQNMNNKMCIWGIILGSGLTVLEYLVSKVALEFYIGTVVMSCSMFMYAIKNPEKELNGMMAKIGEELSMYIYILHVLAIEVAGKLNDLLKFRFYDWLKPIIAIIISVVLAYIGKRIFEQKNKKEVVNYAKS